VALGTSIVSDLSANMPNVVVTPNLSLLPISFNIKIAIWAVAPSLANIIPSVRGRLAYTSLTPCSKVIWLLKTMLPLLLYLSLVAQLPMPISPNCGNTVLVVFVLSLAFQEIAQIPGPCKLVLLIVLLIVKLVNGVIGVNVIRPNLNAVGPINVVHVGLFIHGLGMVLLALVLMKFVLVNLMPAVPNVNSLNGRNGRHVLLLAVVVSRKVVVM
jgi:hypothetical protein